MDLISCSMNVLLFNTLIDFGSSIPFNIVSPNKTCLPIISKMFGIVIFVNDEHPEKAYSPIFCNSTPTFCVSKNLSIS